MSERGPYRIYGDDERAQALRVLEATGRPEVASIATGIPRQTLQNWKANGRLERSVQAMDDQVRRKSEQELENRLERVALRMTDHVLEVPLEKTGVKDAMIAAGIANTHLRLLRSQPTNISVHADLTSFMRSAGYVEVVDVTKELPAKTDPDEAGG